MQWKQIRLWRYNQQQQLQEQIIRREEGQVIIPCGCCKGKGTLANSPCHICRGKGEVSLTEPIRRCAFCHGTGRGHSGTTTTCQVCKGKGAISFTEPVHDCPKCGGKGRGWRGLICIRCGGKGFVSGPEEELADE
jgi:DnaJ-class molecular chaperone